MIKTIMSVEPSTSIHEAMELILDNDIGAMPVINGDGRLAGILSEADRLKLLAQPPRTQNPSVREYMTPGVVTVDKSASLDQVANLMTMVGIRQVPVIECGNVIGIISRRRLVEALHNQVEFPSAEPNG